MVETMAKCKTCTQLKLVMMCGNCHWGSNIVRSSFKTEFYVGNEVTKRNMLRCKWKKAKKEEKKTEEKRTKRIIDHPDEW